MRLAVYGTLRKGGTLHHLLRDSKLISEGFIEGFDMYTNIELVWYPYVKHGSHNVYVEVYDVSPELGEDITEMEESAGYHIETILVNNINTKIFIYDDADAVGDLLDDGNWIKFINNAYARR